MPTAPEEMTLKVIAHIHTAFPTKFGIPRQSGLVDSLRGEVIFTPEYRSAGAGQLVPHRSAAASGRQYPHGRVRHPVPLPAQPLGPFQREAGRHRDAPGGGPRPAGARG